MVSQRHEGGCSCCPAGLGPVEMQEVERRLMAWLKQRHEFLGEQARVAEMLKGYISSPEPPPEALLTDIGEALEHLERVQSGFY